jgi:hypothetical protein
VRISAHPALQEGRCGQSSPNAARDAMDAKCARRSARRGRRNRAVPIPRRWNQASRDEREATVANRPGTPRRTRISRKTIAQGVPVVPAALLMLACAKVHFFCTQGSRVRPASGIPCALSIEGADDRCKTRARCVARTRSHIFSAVVPRLDRGTQYAAAYRLSLCHLWNTGSPAFAGDDTESGIGTILPPCVVLL